MIYESFHPSPNAESKVEEVFSQRDTHIPLDYRNPTTQHLAEEIKENGPIPYSRFMQESLYGADGYYRKGKVRISQNPYESHFITTPEISPYFGTLLCRVCQNIWQRMEKPDIFHIIEMGAGQGSLARSIFQAAEKDSDFYQALQYIIVEYSPSLIPRQKTQLSKGKAGCNTEKISWIQGDATELPLQNIRGVFISNELPDVFPIERIRISTAEKLKQQCYVSVENDKWVEQWGTLQPDVATFFTTYELAPPSGLSNQILEYPANLQLAPFQKGLDTALNQGAVITIDYGNRTADALFCEPDQSVRCYDGGNDHDVLVGYESPGDIDLTANVDFRVLEKVAHEDGLQIELSGSQEEFFNTVGWDDVLDDIKHHQSLGARSQNINFQEVVRQLKLLGAYHVLFTTKNLPKEVEKDHTG